MPKKLTDEADSSDESADTEARIVIHLKRRINAVLILVYLQAAVADLYCQEVTTEAVPSVTVYLIPNETVADVGYDVSNEVREFNAARGHSLVVLNTTVPHLRDQLYSSSPEYGVPKWSVVKGQRVTFTALEQFAREKHINIYIRLLTWGNALSEIKKALNEDSTSALYPDVIQIGTTWRSFLAAGGQIRKPAAHQAGNLTWDTVEGTKTLPYVRDVRIIFFWKRRITDPLGPPFALDDTSWKTIIQSLDDHLASIPGYRPPMVFPVLLSSNILHDYAPLVWSGANVMFQRDSLRIDLTSQDAISVPLLITNRISQVRKDRDYTVFRFPEASHFDAAGHFIAGEYTAIIEPAGFLVRLKREFESRYVQPVGQRRRTEGAVKIGGALSREGQPKRLFDYIGVAVPPKTFIGGSDLMVAMGTPNADDAFRVAQLVASPKSEVSDEYAGDYARVLTNHGFLPQFDHYGVDQILEGLNLSDNTDQVRTTLLRALQERGRTYPDRKDWEKIRTRRIREALQNIWRRMADGDVEAVVRAANDAETEINYVVDPDFALMIDNNRPEVLAARYRGRLYATGLTLSFGLIAAIVAFLRHRGRAHELEKINETLVDLRNVRGFSCSTLHVIDFEHRRLWVTRRLPRVEDEEAVKKALKVLAGIRGWKRGRSDKLWEPMSLEEVIWRSVMVAIDQYCPDTLDQYEETPRQESMESFLRDTAKLMRTERSIDADQPPFHFSLNIPGLVQVHMPLLLEQACICLIQNALRHSMREVNGRRRFEAIDVSYDMDTSVLSIENIDVTRNEQLDEPAVFPLVRKHRTIDGFYDAIQELFKESPDNSASWPGQGIVEAFTIVTTLYGHLSVCRMERKVTVSVEFKRRIAGRDAT